MQQANTFVAQCVCIAHNSTQQLSNIGAHPIENEIGIEKHLFCQPSTGSSNVEKHLSDQHLTADKVAHM